MTQNLLTDVKANIAKSRQEEATPSGTLQRMAMKLHRMAKTKTAEDFAQKVEDFATACTPELEFFRAIAQTSTQTSKAGVARKLQDLLRSVSNFSTPMLNDIRFDSPFKLIEGVALPQNDHQLSGPFFMAVVGNFSEGNEWSPENRSYLFTFAQSPEEDTSKFELRQMNDADFKASVMGEQGEDFRYKISLSAKTAERGNIQDVFAAAVRDMSQYAFGPNSSTYASNAFTRALENYTPHAEISTIAGADTPALGANAAPLALASAQPR